MTACLDISSLSATLGNGQRVLRSVSLSVEPGEVRALVGESGAGKSMIGKAVLGVLPPSVKIVEGSILLEGTDLGTLSPKERRRVVGAVASAIAADLRPEGAESLRSKLWRARLAITDAGTARSEHDRALEARGHIPRGRTEAA